MSDSHPQSIHDLVAEILTELDLADRSLGEWQP